MTECYRCGQDGHRRSECPNAEELPPVSPPQRAAETRNQARVAAPLDKARTSGDHMDRVNGYIQLWLNGKITNHQKRRAIADENLQWHGGPMTRGGISLTTP